MRAVLSMAAALLLLALSARALPAFDVADIPRETGPEINEYIDRLVQEIKKLIIEQNLEPMTLPNLIRDFEYVDIFGIHWTGNASLTNGWLGGLVTIHRDGDVDMTYGTFILHVAGRLTFTHLTMDYQFVADFMDLGPEGEAACTITYTAMDFAYDMDLSTLRSNITYFEIANNGNIGCEIRGLGAALNWLVEIFVNLFINVFEDTILFILSDTIQALLQQALDNIGGFTTAPPSIRETTHHPMLH